jgi:cardiolipin synthase A/B
VGLSPVRRAFVILLVAGIVVAAGLLFAQDQVTLHVRSGVSAEDPAHSAYLSALVGTEPSAGNAFDVLTNGNQIFPAMLSAIDGARRRISFETYIFDTGQIADQFTAALERAARRGVRVNLVIDAVGASSMERQHLKRLRDAGCHVAEFNTPTWYSIEEVNYRTHRKILVVDGEIAFTGGAGVADHWMGDADSKEHWRDTQVRIRGPIVRAIEAVFYENFLEADGPEAPVLDPAPQPAADGDGTAIAVRSSPSGGSGDLKRVYLLSLAAAKRSVEITTPYFVTDESTMWALEDAVKRGVKVRVVLEGDVTDAMPVKYASRYQYEHLMQLGIELYEYQPTMMHAKVLIVDGIWSMFGSANFDNRSLELNDELNVAVSSRTLAARFLEDFDRDLKASKRIELEDWRHRSRLARVRETFWMAFGEVF